MGGTVVSVGEGEVLTIDVAKAEEATEAAWSPKIGESDEDDDKGEDVVEGGEKGGVGGEGWVVVVLVSMNFHAM